MQVLFIFPRSWIVIENFFSLCFDWVVFCDITLVIVYKMLKGIENVIEIDDDELDILPSLLTDHTFDLGIPLEPIRSSVGTNARRISLQITSQ